MHTKRTVAKLTLAVLLLLLSACGSMPIARCPLHPRKSRSSRQGPAAEAPALCSPTCSQGLTKLRESLQGTQTGPNSRRCARGLMGRCAD